MYWSKRPPGRVVLGLSMRNWNQKHWMASRKVRGGSMGTRAQVWLMVSSSALRTGSDSAAAMSAASLEYRPARVFMASKAMIMAS